MVAGFGKAPCALIEKSRQVFCAEQGGVDLRIDLRGLGGFLFRKQRLGLHHHGCVDARVLGVGFFVKLQKCVDLLRHELSFDLEEAEQAVVGGVEAELAIGLGEALDFAKHRQRFGVGLEPHVRAGGDH